MPLTFKDMWDLTGWFRRKLTRGTKSAWKFQFWTNHENRKIESNCTFWDTIGTNFIICSY